MRWESIAELRFAVPPEATTKPPKLQQKWVQRIDARETASEWRDVPTVVVPQPKAETMRRADWHYDSQGYCDNPGRGY